MKKAGCKLVKMVIFLALLAKYLMLTALVAGYGIPVST